MATTTTTTTTPTKPSFTAAALGFDNDDVDDVEWYKYQRETANSSFFSSARCPLCCKTGKKLSACSRCKIVFYCGRQCQKDDYNANHKTICRQVAKLKTDIDKKQNDLLDAANNRELKNRIVQEILPMRRKLCVLKEQVANDTKNLVLHKEVVSEMQEVLNEDVHDLANFRSFFPFLLLKINRDQDVIDFCYHWLFVERDRFFPISERRRPQQGLRPDSVGHLPIPPDTGALRRHETMHERAVRGEDWYYYPKVYDYMPLIRTGEFSHRLYFQHPGLFEMAFAPFPFPALVAICMAKMKIVADFDARKAAFESFASQVVPFIEDGMLGPTLHLIRDFLLPSSIGDDGENSQSGSQWMEIERGYISDLLDDLHEANQFALPALVYPSVFRQHKDAALSSYFIVPGTPSPFEQVEFALKYAREQWMQIPGAAAALEARYPNKDDPKRYFLLSS